MDAMVAVGNKLDPVAEAGVMYAMDSVKEPPVRELKFQDWLAPVFLGMALVESCETHTSRSPGTGSLAALVRMS